MGNVLIIRTKKESDSPVEINGVGVLPAGGRGGRPIADVAAVLHELQHTVLNEDTKQPETVPLEHKALEKAARAFAEDRGLEVASLSEAKVADLPLALGAAPDRPPANEVAVEEHRKMFGLPTGDAPPADQASSEPAEGNGGADTKEA